MLKQNKIRIAGVIVSAVVLFSFQNCAYGPATGAVFNGGSGENTVSSESLALEKAAMGILATNCSACHNENNAQGGLSNVTDIESLKYFRYVVPREPMISPLYEMIASGEMPPSRPLPAHQIKALYDWIYKGMTDEIPPGGVISSGPLEAKWSSISRKIIVPRCTQCHNDNTADGGINLTSYDKARNSGAFIAGNAGGSKIYIQVSTGRMPRNPPLLEQKDITTIRDWIANGAAND